MGCYTVQPIAGQNLPVGATLVLVINDAGRVALGGSMGPAIGEIEGRLLEKDSTGYLVSVTQIRMLGGGEQVWSGERIQVRTEFVNSVSERKFSRSKTALIAAGAVGIVAIVFSKGLVGSLSGDDGQVPPDTGAAVRYPRFKR